MQLVLPQPDPVVGSAAIFRLLAIGLAALALALAGRPADATVGLVGAGYLAIVGLLWHLGRRADASRLAYPGAIVDSLAVTVLLGLMPAPGLPLWPLYLFPLACAAAAGTRPAVAAAVMSIAGYLGATARANGGLSVLDCWPPAVLAAAVFTMTSLAVRWRAEVRRRRAWQEIAVAARGMRGDGDPGEVATRVVERARRLVRAAQASLWWYEGDVLRPGAQVGPPAAEPLLDGAVAEELVRRLERGTVPLAKFQRTAADIPGEVLALVHGGARVALLAVAWDGPPSDRSARRQRLQLLAPWAADALARARSQAQAREHLRREGVLRQAAADLAATLERRTVEGVLVRAARSALAGAAALVEGRSGQVIAGDQDLVEAVVRATPAGDAPRTGDGDATTPEVAAPASMVRYRLGPDLELVARRAEPPLDDADRACLESVARLGEAALERCAAHERLELEKERLKASIEALPAPLGVWDLEGRLLVASAQYHALALDAAPGGELVPTGLAEREITIGDPPRTFVVLTTAGRETPYVMSLYREITRERGALRAKDELIAMAGHELRNPLASVQGYSQIMARQLGIMQRQLDQLNRLIGDFMDASRLEDGQLPLSREPVDLAALARGAAERFRGAHQGRALRLELADVPPVEADPGRLRQVLDNLLGNAAKYSGEGEPIALTVREDGEEVIAAVQDHGVGIAPEHLPHVFDRLYRVPGADTQRVAGQGLGLSIVRDLVEAHGGRAWAESAGPGFGSTFFVALPVSREVGVPPSDPVVVGG